MEEQRARIGLVRGVVALAVAQVVATALALFVDPETVGAALLATLPLVPGIVGVVVLEAVHRPILARVVYVLWLAGLLVALAVWTELTGDAIVRQLRSVLVPFWLFTGVAAWGVLRRGWPLAPRLTA